MWTIFTFTTFTIFYSLKIICLKVRSKFQPNMTKIQASSDNFCTSTMNKKIIHVPTALAALGLKLNGVHLKIHHQRSRGSGYKVNCRRCAYNKKSSRLWSKKHLTILKKNPNEFKNANPSPKKDWPLNFCEWFPLLRFLITFFYAGLLGFACSVSASKICCQMVILQNRGGKCWLTMVESEQNTQIEGFTG